MEVKDIIQYLTTIAPEQYQEPYDNSGLIVGNMDLEVSGVLCTLDCIESVIDEAITKNCNLIITHHPIIFSGLKSLTGRHYIERTIIKAIKKDIAIYAIHTNLDNMLHNGVNTKIAEKLDLLDCTILVPKKDKLKKLVVFIPEADTPRVVKSLHKIGVGNIGNYSDCRFQVKGEGYFTPNHLANPTIGKSFSPEKVVENRVEMIFPAHLESLLLKTLRDVHPYEEVAHYIQPIDNTNQEVGAGILGHLKTPMPTQQFLEKLKKEFKLAIIRHTELIKNSIQKIAICGGSGSNFLPNAIAANADIFITADFKYHQFFEADKKVIIADIGHFESEQFTSELLFHLIQNKFSNFAVYFSERNTNPVKYF